MIHSFRNPVFEEMLYHQANYDANTDSIRRHHYGFDEFPFEYCTIDYFNMELDRRLNEMRAEIAAYISDIKKSKRRKDLGRKKILEQLFAHLQAIQLRADKNEISQYKEAIDSFFSSLYGLIAVDVNKPIELSFIYRSKDNYVLERLYSLSIKGIAFIDKGETDWNMFKSILTSPNVYDESIEYKIQFQCPTRTAAYILRNMEHFFLNLNFATIVSSERFYSQRGTLIKGSNLDVSLRRDKKPIRNQKSIDDFLFNL